MIRDWFDIAYYPVPRIEGEPLTSPHLSFINSPMGDIFDVLVAADSPQAEAGLGAYRAVVLSGDVRLNEQWGRALRSFVENGGTVVVTDDQVQGAGVTALGLPTDKANYQTGHAVVWKGMGGAADATLESNTYRYRQNVPTGTVLATAENGSSIVVERTLGRGHIVWIGIPKGLGLDDRATPALSEVMLHLREGLLPITVTGDVKYSLNRNDTGWVVTLMNNRGNYKPEHGLGIPHRDEIAHVTLSTALPVTKATEWIGEQDLPVSNAGGQRTVTLDVAAGDIRIVHLAGS
jgi:hypothetical protein